MTEEWVDKAEEDWRVAEREFRLKRAPAYSAVSFHAQQCAEKYVKAVLAEATIPIPRSHDLVSLRSLALPACPPLARIRRMQLARLSEAAVEYRYPGRKATKRIASSAMSVARSVRTACRKHLGV